MLGGGYYTLPISTLKEQNTTTMLSLQHYFIKFAIEMWKHPPQHHFSIK